MLIYISGQFHSCPDIGTSLFGIFMCLKKTKQRNIFEDFVGVNKTSKAVHLFVSSNIHSQMVFDCLGKKTRFVMRVFITQLLPLRGQK